MEIKGDENGSHEVSIISCKDKWFLFDNNNDKLLEYEHTIYMDNYIYFKKGYNMLRYSFVQVYNDNGIIVNNNYCHPNLTTNTFDKNNMTKNTYIYVKI